MSVIFGKSIAGKIGTQNDQDERNCHASTLAHCSCDRVAEEGSWIEEHVLDRWK